MEVNGMKTIATQMKYYIPARALWVLAFVTCGHFAGAASYEWRFSQGDLTADLGNALMTYADGDTPGLTTFGTTDGTTVPHISGQPAQYIHFLQFPSPANGFNVEFMDLLPNGGGAYVNQYTFIIDLLMPAPRNWAALLNTNPGNANDADFYISDAGSLGIAGAYSAQNVIQTAIWYRLAVSVNTAGNMVWYVNGTQVHSQSGGGLNDRWSLNNSNQAGPDIRLFNEGDGSGNYTHELYLASFAFTDRVMSSVEIVTLGGPSANGILIPGLTEPLVTSTSPNAGQVSVAPTPAYTATIQDGDRQVNTNTIQLKLNGSSVTPAPTITKPSDITTISFQGTGLLPRGSTNTFTLTFKDNGMPIRSHTNEVQFVVAQYENLVLPAHKYMENFNSVSEGTLPADWTLQNFTTLQTMSSEPQDITSDFYVDWAVISPGTATFLSTNYPVDYSTLFSASPSTVVNGAAVTTLIDGASILAASAGRIEAGIQVQYLFTGDYDLTGADNVYLVFNSIYVQNQDSLGSVEYSIDGGSTWLPGLYLLDTADIVLDGMKSIDALNTFATVRDDISDLATGMPGPNGKYGDFIGVAADQWSTLGPYIRARLNDDETESKRIEVIRLVEADDQPAVRFRIAQSGSSSWYFAMDNFGIYCLTTVPRPLIGTVTPASQTVAVGNEITLSVTASGAMPMTFQWRKDGLNISGANAPRLPFTNIQTGDDGSYTVVITNPGGSVTSSVPTTLTVLNPAVFVTGQWDFKNSNLTATCGQDLQFRGDTAASTEFPTMMIGGQDTTVMQFPACTASQGYIMPHGAAPNGGGVSVNQYTLIMDIMFPAADSGDWRALFQTSTANSLANEAEFYVSPGNAIGIANEYHGTIQPDTWHRVAFAVDLAASGNQRLAKFIDGVKVGTQDIGGLDDRFSLDPTAILFTDGYDPALYTQGGFLSSIQFSKGRRSDAYIAALGAPTANRIPGCVRGYIQGGNIFIERTGGWGLECADEVTGTWSEIVGAANPYQVPGPPGARRFYRPKQP